MTGYYVGYKEDGKDEPYSYKTLMTLESESPEHFVHIMNLKKITKYAVVVQAYNEQGKGPMSEPIVAMTSEGGLLWSSWEMISTSVERNDFLIWSYCSTKFCTTECSLHNSDFTKYSCGLGLSKFHWN